MKTYKLPQQEQTKIQEQIKAAGMTTTTVAIAMMISDSIIYDWTHGRTGIPLDRLTELWKLINRAESIDAIIEHVNTAIQSLNNLDNAQQMDINIQRAFTELDSMLKIHQSGICGDCDVSGRPELEGKTDND